MNSASVSSPPVPRIPGWLLLVHQIPPKPDYFRAKVRRRLQRIGALPLKNSVYLLPNRDEAVESFRWLLGEITAEGGSATLWEAAALEGLADAELEALFRNQVNEAYADVVVVARKLVAQAAGSGRRRANRSTAASELPALKRRLAEITEIDYFAAAGGGDAQHALEELEALVTRGEGSGSPTTPPRGRAWVTRKGVFVDRIASAWLIRRFIDREARFKFVPARGYRPEPGELRFDMYDGEYTHEGDRCTFETLVHRFKLRDPALVAIAEIVHAIDLKDDKYDRVEAPGVALVLTGLTKALAGDQERLERGAAIFDGLYAELRRR